MSVAALTKLIEHAEALIAALDGDDPARIQAAAALMRPCMLQVAAIERWQARPDAKDDLVKALKLAETAAARANYLADRNHRQLHRLAALTGAPRAMAYGRSGRLG